MLLRPAPESCHAPNCLGRMVGAAGSGAAMATLARIKIAKITLRSLIKTHEHRTSSLLDYRALGKVSRWERPGYCSLSILLATLTPLKPFTYLAMPRYSESAMRWRYSGVSSFFSSPG